MEYVWAIALTIVVLGVSLYNYFDSRDMNQLTSAVHNNLVFSQRNKRYGAYSMRKSYNQVMLFILGGTVVVFAIATGTHYTFARGGNVPNIMKTPQIVDTTLLSLETPPEEQEKTLPPSYSIKSNAGAGGNSSNNRDEQEEVKKSDVSGDVRETENGKPGGSREQEKPATEKTDRKTITDVRDPEYYRYAGSDAVAAAKARADERKRKEEERKRIEAERAAGNNNKGSKGNEGSIPNKPMVSWDMDGRDAYAHEESNVKNPGYTCGKGEGGTVVVKVKVNANGNVISAEPTGNFESVDYCLRQRSVEYALKSRFEPSSKPIQEGTITYKFKPQ